jgi:branched-chain amino acid aminotransferase
VEERPVTIDELVVASEKGLLQEAFGAGTAAVVSLVSEISYNGKVLTIPTPTEDGIAHLVKSEIEGLRSGRITDTHGWVVPVKVEELV